VGHHLHLILLVRSHAGQAPPSLSEGGCPTGQAGASFRRAEAPECSCRNARSRRNGGRSSSQPLKPLAAGLPPSHFPFATLSAVPTRISSLIPKWASPSFTLIFAGRLNSATCRTSRSPPIAARRHPILLCRPARYGGCFHRSRLRRPPRFRLCSTSRDINCCPWGRAVISPANAESVLGRLDWICPRHCTGQGCSGVTSLYAAPSEEEGHERIMMMEP
jgi:hypothetical protein